jgi:hypothetical protein
VKNQTPDQWNEAWGQPARTRTYTAAPPTPTVNVVIQKPRRTGRKIVIGIILLFGLIAIIKSASNSASSGTHHGAAPINSSLGAGTAAHPASADVTLSSCGVDDAGFSNANATVTNHSSKASDYSFQVNFVNASGVVVDQGYGMLNNVASGQTATTQVIGGQGGTPARCQVVDVQRNESY